MAYYATGNARQLRVNPYLPDRSELIGTNAKQASSADIGKAVKLSGDGVVLCADGDEIYGFIASVEAASHNGHSYGGIVCDVGRDMVAKDEVGGLAVGNLVVASTLVAFGTTITAPNVKIAAGTEAKLHKWQVVGLETTPSVAGGEVLIRKI